MDELMDKWMMVLPHLLGHWFHGITGRINFSWVHCCLLKPGRVFISPGRFFGLEVRDLEEVIFPWLAYGMCKNIWLVVFENEAEESGSIVTPQWPRVTSFIGNLDGFFTFLLEDGVHLFGNLLEETSFHFLPKRNPLFKFFLLHFLDKVIL